jgi:hypothetical protein
VRTHRRFVLGISHRHDVARLIFTKRLPGTFEHMGPSHETTIAGERHFRDRDQAAAIRDVVDRGQNPVTNEFADHLSISPFGLQLDGGPP